MHVIQMWFEFRMHGTRTLVKKAAVHISWQLLLAKMRQDLATLILVAGTSGFRTTCVTH